MVSATGGTLVQCDPSIRALIIQMDTARNDIILQELDETHLFIVSDKVQYVKNELNLMLSKNIYNPFEEEEEN